MSSKFCNDNFIRGVVYACGELCRYYDEPIIAKQILEDAGIGMKEIMAAGCDNFDYEPLVNLFEDKDE